MFLFLGLRYFEFFSFGGFLSNGVFSEDLLLLLFCGLVEAVMPSQKQACRACGSRRGSLCLLGCCHKCEAESISVEENLSASKSRREGAGEAQSQARQSFPAVAPATVFAGTVAISEELVPMAFLMAAQQNNLESSIPASVSSLLSSISSSGLFSPDFVLNMHRAYCLKQGLGEGVAGSQRAKKGVPLRL